MMLMAVVRLVGHVATGPIGVADQSIARIRAPMSPPPARTASTSRSFILLPLKFDHDASDTSRDIRSLFAERHANMYRRSAARYV